MCDDFLWTKNRHCFTSRDDRCVITMLHNSRLHRRYINCYNITRGRLAGVRLRPDELALRSSNWCCTFNNDCFNSWFSFFWAASSCFALSFSLTMKSIHSWWFATRWRVSRIRATCSVTKPLILRQHSWLQPQIVSGVSAAAGVSAMFMARCDANVMARFKLNAKALITMWLRRNVSIFAE